MSKQFYREENDRLDELIQQFENQQKGNGSAFFDEESYEMIVHYYEDREEVPKALEAVNLGIEQYPYSSGLLVKKADLYLALHKFNEALDILDYVHLLDSGDINLYILKTEAYLALDRQEKAVTLLEDALGHFEGEDRLELLFELADVYDDYEEFDKVFDCLKMILQQDPVNEEALFKICFWTDFTGRNEEGIRLHQHIIEDFPYNELAWFNLAAAYQGLKLYEKAIDAYQYSVAIDEKFDYAYRNMGDAYIRLRRYRDAIEVLEKVLELTRPEDVIYEAIGHCYDKMGNHAQARFNYRKASHLNANDSQLNYKIACTYMNEGQWESALKNLEIALRIHRMQPEYNLAMGQCYMELDKLEEAITCFGNVVRVRPKNIGGWSELLKCLYKAEMFEEALEYADVAYEQTDKKPIFIFYKSAFLFTLGKTKEALIQLESGMNRNPKLVKKFVEINPSFLQLQQVVDIIARHKKKRSL